MEEALRVLSEADENRRLKCRRREFAHRLPSDSWSGVSTSASVLFVAHGSPMFALEPGAEGAALAELATNLERPRAVLVISPHRETEVAAVSTASRLTTIHDFGGFDPALYALQYPASGSPLGAQEVFAVLAAAGLPVSTDAERGLDHGAWVPLRYLFPAADVPVVPLSIQHQGGPEHAYRVGQALAPLVEREDLSQGAREALVRSAPRCRAGEPAAPYLRRCITGA
ncbi:MAG: DODA-type extradiol aromatic ring-opening family dioxygenase, partial [Cyanobium sp.]